MCFGQFPQGQKKKNITQRKHRKYPDDNKKYCGNSKTIEENRSHLISRKRYRIRLVRKIQLVRKISRTLYKWQEKQNREKCGTTIFLYKTHGPVDKDIDYIQ